MKSSERSSAVKASPHKQYLTMRFDVSDLTPDEQSALEMEVAVQAESSDGHPDVPTPVTYSRAPEQALDSLLAAAKHDPNASPQYIAGIQDAIHALEDLTP